MPKTPGTIPDGFAGARGQERAKALGCGLHSWTFAEWGTQVHRATCRSLERGKRASSSAIRWTKPVGLDALWERLSKRMTAELEPDSVWVIDDTGFAKQGKHSVGVERQYSGTLGKVGNCQVAVSLHHVGEQGSTVLGWRLYLPESWTKDSKRREEAGIPQEVVFKTKWQLSLNMIDQARA